MPDFKARHLKNQAQSAKLNAGNSAKVFKKKGITGNETGITGFVTADQQGHTSEIHHNGKSLFCMTQ